MSAGRRDSSGPSRSFRRWRLLARTLIAGGRPSLVEAELSEGRERFLGPEDRAERGTRPTTDEPFAAPRLVSLAPLGERCDQGRERCRCDCGTALPCSAETVCKCRLRLRAITRPKRTGTAFPICRARRTPLIGSRGA